ncbi:MAG: hypothetical protein AAB739_04995 [Patescibacteria group bacterium]
MKRMQLLIKSILRASKEAKNGKNITKAMTPKEAIAYLKKP